MNGRNVVPLHDYAASVPVPIGQRLRYPSDITGPPPPPVWTVDGMIRPGTVCLFAGASTVGKTLAAQQMLTAIALGREWMGRPTEQARAFALFTEDQDDDLDRRAIAIAEHYEVDVSATDHELAWYACAANDSVIWVSEFGKGQPTFLWHQLFGDQGLIADHGYRVLLLDTAARVFQINHNNTSAVSEAMGALTREAIRHNLAIILNTHPSKGDKRSFGGSGQWEAAARAGFNLARPKPPDGMDDDEMRFGDYGLQRVFSGLGSNYAAAARPERWRYRDGIFVLDDEPDRRPRHKREMTESERMDVRYRLLIGCKRALQRGVAIPGDVTASRSLPNLGKAYAPELKDVPFRELYAAQEALIEAGQLVMVKVGQRCLLRPCDFTPYDHEEAWTLGGG